MKRIIIILAILIGVSIPVLIVYVYKVVIIPAKIKLILPKESELKVDSFEPIVIRIDEKENFFINDNKTQLSMITKQIDSLGFLGYHDSTIIVDADKRVMLSFIVQIMNLVKDTDRKMIIKTNPID